MRLLKLAGVAFVALLIIAAGAAVVLWWQIRAAPAFYRRYSWTEPQRSVLNQQAVNNMLTVQKSAQEIYYGAIRARRTGTGDGDAETGQQSSQPVTLTLTEEQANAFITHNGEVFSHIQDRYAHLFTEPAIFFRNGRIILAGRIRRPECLASLHYRVGLDNQGRLYAVLERTMAGRVPAPPGILEGRMQRAAESLSPSIEAWKRQAKMDDAGGMNSAAVCAGLGMMLRDIAAGRPVPAVVFVPVDDKGTALPMKITAVGVQEDALTISAVPMRREERTALLARIKS